MNETAYMILAFVAGLTLGAIFFGGLWFTVRKTLDAKSPGLLVLVSFIVRGGIVLVGFYFVAAGSWQRLLVALAGFVLARFIVLRLTKQWDEKQKKEETGHEA